MLEASKSATSSQLAVTAYAEAKRSDNLLTEEETKIFLETIRGAGGVIWKVHAVVRLQEYALRAEKLTQAERESTDLAVRDRVRLTIGKLKIVENLVYNNLPDVLDETLTTLS